jgi:hypothetical protein
MTDDREEREVFFRLPICSRLHSAAESAPLLIEPDRRDGGGRKVARQAMSRPGGPW